MGSISDIFSTFVNTNTLLSKIQQTLSSGLPGLLPNGIPLSGLAQVPNNTLLGNASGATGNVSALSVDQIYPMLGIQFAPQGRLTLTTNTPVMTVDVSGATGIYYTPYVGNIVPIYDGTVFNMKVFSQLTMTLSTGNNTSGNVYDLYVFASSGTPAIASSPAWSNSTGRGTGTSPVIQSNGLWVNSGVINLTNGATLYSGVTGSYATYVGTFYCTTNGQTAMMFRPTPATGGTNNVLGVWNAYNRTPIFAMERDSTPSWTYSNSTWRPSNSGASGAGLNNRITWVDGLGQSRVRAEQVQLGASLISGVATPEVGILFNASSGIPSGKIGALETSATIQGAGDMVGFDTTIALGLNYAQAMEYNGSSGSTAQFDGNGFQALTLSIDI